MCDAIRAEAKGARWFRRPGPTLPGGRAGIVAKSGSAAQLQAVQGTACPAGVGGADEWAAESPMPAT
jgi:hypothetical protein